MVLYDFYIWLKYINSLKLGYRPYFIRLHCVWYGTGDWFVFNYATVTNACKIPFIL